MNEIEGIVLAGSEFSPLSQLILSSLKVEG